MYEWISRHRMLSVVLLLLTPIYIMGGIFLFEQLGNLTGIHFNYVELTGKEWFMFWGSLIGGMATLFAVVLTINHSIQERKQELEEQSTPALIATPLEHRGKEVAGNIRCFVGSDGRIVFSLDNGFSADNKTEFHYKITNFGMGAATNIFFDVLQNSPSIPKTRNEAIPVNLLPYEAFSLTLTCDWAEAVKRLDFTILLGCQTIYGKRQLFTFPVTTEYFANGKIICGMNLMPQAAPYNPPCKTHISIGVPSVPWLRRKKK